MKYWGLGLVFEQAIDQQAPMLQSVGGMDRIAYAIYDRVKPAVQFGTVVKRIAQTPDGVRMVYASGTGPDRAIEADYCICTIPLTVLQHVASNLPSAVKDAIARGAATYGAGTKVAWEARRFWEQDEAIYGGLAWTDELSNLLWYPSGGFDQPKGVLVGAHALGFSGQKNADAFDAMRFEERFAISRRVNRTTLGDQRRRKMLSSIRRNGGFALGLRRLPGCARSSLITRGFRDRSRMTHRSSTEKCPKGLRGQQGAACSWRRKNGRIRPEWTNSPMTAVAERY